MNRWSNRITASILLLATVLMVLLGLVPLRAQTPSAAVVKIQTYYQQLRPTIQQAARLSVRERDKRFSPVFAEVLDIPTMTRLAVSGLEKLLGRTAGGGPGRLCPLHRCRICKPDKGLFRRKLRRRSADDTRIAWRRRDRQNEAAAAGRSDRQHKLPGPRRAGGRHLSQRKHQRSRHAARRIRVRHCGRRC